MGWLLRWGRGVIAGGLLCGGKIPSRVSCDLFLASPLLIACVGSSCLPWRAGAREVF
jgi:hypothetical protein